MIGVFDSGVGGLSVWNEIVKILPEEEIIYFGDSAYCPYGRKSKKEIILRVTKIVDFLIEKGCGLIVVACNTVTAAAIDYLRKSYDIPFVGMEPALKPAVLNSKTGVVGVLATHGTLKGELYHRTLHKYASDTKVLEQAGDGLVELVESGEINSAKGETLLRRYIVPMIEQNADHIVLGCTHYPFLINQIEHIVGHGVTIVNPAPAVAKHTVEILNQERGVAVQHLTSQIINGDNLSAECDSRRFHNGKYQFYTTGHNGDVIKKLSSCNILPESIHEIDL
jgi:glutamate racemase